MTASGRSLPGWRWLLLAPLPVLLWAAWQHHLFTPLPQDWRLLVLAIAAWHLLLAAALWGRARAGLVGVAPLPALLAIATFAGVGGVAAAGLIALVALALGQWLGGRSLDLGLAVLVGLAVLAGALGWSSALPLHRRWLYLLLALPLLWVQRHAIAAAMARAFRRTRVLARRHPLPLLLLSFAASVASTGLWLPSLNYDDNALHLSVPAQLLAFARYQPDLLHQAWGYVPWANNLLHGAAAVLAGHEARAAVALLWLLLGIDGARRLARALGAAPAVALGAAALYAALPFTGYFTTSQQVDGAGAVLLLHLAAIAVRPPHQRPRARVVGALIGLALGLKTLNLLFVLPLLAWLLWSQPAGRTRWLLTVLGVATLVGGSSYAMAAWATGNPLFPFYNGWFRSPFYPAENFRDGKWMAGIHADSLWQLTFDSARYGQYVAGAAGVSLLALLPVLLLDACRRPPLRWLALWALACGALLFWQMQYLRYLYPLYAVLGVLGVVALARWVAGIAAAGVLVLLVGMDALLMPTTAWYLRDAGWLRMLREGPAAAHARLSQAVVPERGELQAVLARDPGACVLLADPRRPFIASAPGHAVSLHRRYAPAYWQAARWADADASGGRWQRLLAEWRPSHVLSAPATRSPALAAALARTENAAAATGDRIFTLSRAPGSPPATACLPSLTATP